MWNSGSLTVDTLVFPAGFSDWIPITTFLERFRAEPISLSATPTSIRPLGVVLIIVGAAITLYFAAVYDTSVHTDRRYISGVGFVGGESVVNLGKQQNRLIGVIVGIALGVTGVVLSRIPSKPSGS